MQRTAYESRSSDWSSYVCSSDLRNAALLRAARHEQHDLRASRGLLARPGLLVDDLALRCLLVGRRLLADRELALDLADEPAGLCYLGAAHLGHGERVLPGAHPHLDGRAHLDALPASRGLVEDEPHADIVVSH